MTIGAIALRVWGATLHFLHTVSTVWRCTFIRYWAHVHFRERGRAKDSCDLEPYPGCQLLAAKAPLDSRSLYHWGPGELETGLWYSFEVQFGERPCEYELRFLSPYDRAGRRVKDMPEWRATPLITGKHTKAIVLVTCMLSTPYL